jgi:hypothetical protein
LSGLNNKVGTGLDLGNVGLKAGSNSIGSITNSFALDATVNTLFKAGQNIGNTGFNVNNQISGYALESTNASNGTKIDAINTTLGTPFQAGGALGAGSNIIGRVGIDQTTNGTTNRVNIGNDGIISIKSEVAVVGANVPTVDVFNTAGNTIVTNNTMVIYVENTGTQDATISYGGVTYTLAHYGNNQPIPTFREFTAHFDEASRKYCPFAPLIVNGSATGTIVVTKYGFQ